jgi:hypothetical protein
MLCQRHVSGCGRATEGDGLCRWLVVRVPVVVAGVVMMGCGSAIVVINC